jgi:hypothetical protein
LAAGRWLFEQGGYPPHLATDPAAAEVLVGFWREGRTPQQVLDDPAALAQVAHALFYGPEPEEWIAARPGP